MKLCFLQDIAKLQGQLAEAVANLKEAECTAQAATERAQSAEQAVASARSELAASQPQSQAAPSQSIEAIEAAKDAEFEEKLAKAIQGYFTSNLSQRYSLVPWIQERHRRGNG